MINYEDVGKNVRLLQYFLNISADGIYGKGTRKAVEQWKLNNNIRVGGGVVTKELFDGVIKPQAMERELPHIKLANSLVGEAVELDVDDDGESDNRGLLIDEFIKVCFPNFDFDDKTKKGYAWCACFISWVLTNSYSGVIDYKSALAREWITFASTKSNDSKIVDIRDLRYDHVYIGGWVKDNGYGHVYFVDPFKSILNSKQAEVVTVEGNTNINGSREGDGIFLKKRNLNNTQLYGFKL